MKTEELYKHLYLFIRSSLLNIEVDSKRPLQVIVQYGV